MGQCKECHKETIFVCAKCGEPICGRHNNLRKGILGSFCNECRPDDRTIVPVRGCGECPSCEEGHPERCAKGD